jgi:hypothetical protein
MRGGRRGVTIVRPPCSPPARPASWQPTWPHSRSPIRTSTALPSTGCGRANTPASTPKVIRTWTTPGLACTPIRRCANTSLCSDKGCSATRIPRIQRPWPPPSTSNALAPACWISSVRHQRSTRSSLPPTPALRSNWSARRIRSIRAVTWSSQPTTTIRSTACANSPTRGAAESATCRSSCRS